MSDWQPHVSDRVPTLTEVLELPVVAEAEPGEAENLATIAVPAAPQGMPDTVSPENLSLAPENALLVAEVLAELQPRLDMLFESRLREALAPALARAAEGLIREARGELGTALHGLVSDAVKRALQRRSGWR